MSVVIFPQTGENPMEKKSILKSKTFWVNALTVAVGVATYLGGSEVIAQYPVAVSVIAVVVGALNVALRFVTNKPVK